MEKNNLLLINILLFFLVSCLGISTFYYKDKSAFVQQQLAFTQDTLMNTLSKNDDWVYLENAKLMGIGDLNLGDSLIELHSISWVNSKVFAVKVAVYLDSTVVLNYKRGELSTTTETVPQKGKEQEKSRNRLKLNLCANETKRLNYAQWQEFNQKMSKISFLDAAKNKNYMCCITTGTLKWEAIIAPDTQLKHATWCRQSVEFAEACEFVFQFFDDPKLNTALEYARQ